MAKLPIEAQKRAVERHFPGWQLVDPEEKAEPDAASAAEPAEPAEARSPDIDELRRKFLGRRTGDGRRTVATRSTAERRDRTGGSRRPTEGAAGAGGGEAAADADASGEYEDTVVTVRAQNAYDDAIGAPGDKKVILSGEDGAPKYAQG